MGDFSDLSDMEEYLGGAEYGADVPDHVVELKEEDFDDDGAFGHAGNYDPATKFIFPLCKFCQGDKTNARHFLHRCEKFGKASVAAKKDFLRSEKRCWNCLAPGHQSSKCSRSGRCSKCQGKHHTLICEEPRKDGMQGQGPRRDN